MKRIMLLFFLIAVCAFFSCRKKEKAAPDNRQYSYWSVDGYRFSTNHVVANTYHSPGNAVTVIRAEDPGNNFEIDFTHLGSFPQSGDSPLQDSSIHYPVGGTVGIYFLYNSKSYFIAFPTDHYLSAASANGKGQYTLSPTWFYGYSPGDSVLISGTFNEP